MSTRRHPRGPESPRNTRIILNLHDMKFTVPSKTLYSYVSAVSKVINSKNALTILNNFLFRFEGNTLTITASDMEHTLTARVLVTDPEGSGLFCIDARRMVELLGAIPEQPIRFDIDDSNLAVKITYPGGEYNLIAINGIEYPQPKKEDEGGEPMEFNAPGEQIIKGIDNTLFAVSGDELRPQMMGILWDITPEAITFVATDTRKLVRYRNSMSAPGVEGKFILPVKPATIIKNVFGKDAEVKIKVEAKSATFESDDYTFNCRFIKGNFPDYNRVIPQNNPSHMTIDRSTFVNAVRRVGIFVSAGNGLVKFKLGDDKVVLKSQDNTVCSMAFEELPCQYEGNAMVIGLSAPYLVEICTTISTTDIIMKLSDPGRPVVIVPDENEADSDLLMLLTPMNVTDF